MHKAEATRHDTARDAAEVVEAAEKAVRDQLADTDIVLARQLSQRLRTARLRQDLLTGEGGCFTSRDIGKALGISHNTVVGHEKAGRVFSVTDRGRKLYPIWQYDEGGVPYPGLQRVLKHYDPPSRFMLLAFFLSPHPDDDDARPLDWLRSHRDDDLEDLARFEAAA